MNIRQVPSKLFVNIFVFLLRVDEQRIKEKGPDGACAEWLIRNGAFLQWKGLPGLHTNYITLPSPIAQGRTIEKIHAEDSSISSAGFRHMGQLEPNRTFHFPYNF